MYSVFAESKNLSQVKVSNNQIHTIQSYIAENTLSQYIRGECTLSYYFAEIHAAFLLCWAIPSINTLLWYTLL